MLDVTSPILRPVRPHVLRTLPSLLIIVALAVLPVLATAFDQPFLVRVLTRVMVFAVAAVSLNVLLGFAGLISVMHAALFGIGGYTIAILASHVDMPLTIFGLAFKGTDNLLVSLPIAMLVSAAVAGVLGIVALRTRGAYFIMITLAFNQMIYYFFVSFDAYGGDEGLQISSPLRLGSLPLEDRTTIYYLCLGVLLVVLAGASRLVQSRFGTVIRAAMGNERRVAAVGISPTRYQLMVFVIAGAVAGLAGVLLAISQQFVSPADMAWTRSGELIVMVVLGGMATVWGPVVGVALYVVVETLLSGLTIHWQLPFGILIILMVLFLRHGIAGVLTAVGTHKGEKRHHA
ncbi:branched-chain amino acid ABC transporter permease [Cupriavidus sp. 2TAF22]|uniref:branched-chain amino acid ABC transporter permease n=1 Tax=unclassified Cupriavidus TaxID=2640874 RepID=UPI003F924F40